MRLALLLLVLLTSSCAHTCHLKDTCHVPERPIAEPIL